MNYWVIISPIAFQNVDNAVSFYSNNVSKNVASKFLDEYKTVIKALEINPHYQIRYRKFRALPCNKFPFVAFFEIGEEVKEVRIKGVFHTSRNPSKYP